ncbi:MAG: hypothetical protein ACYC2U_02965, partial [Candidatus Amoebophilus sp.]
MSLSKITKRNKDLLFLKKLFVYFISILSFTTSCKDCTGNTGKDGNKKFGGINNIAVDKHNLEGPNRKFILRLLLEDGNKAVNLSEYELVCMIKNGKLEYTIFQGNSNVEKKEQESSVTQELTQFFKTSVLDFNDINNNMVNIPFTILPADPSIGQVTVTIELFKKNGKNRESIGKEKVEWRESVAPAGEIKLVGINDFVGNEIAKFKLKNETKSAIKPNEIKLTIVANNDAEFRFCKHDGTPITNPVSLKEILDNDNEILVGQETEEIFLKLKDAKTHKLSKLTILVKKDNYSNAESVNWAKENVQLDFATIDNKVKGITPKINFMVKNIGTHNSEKNKLKLRIKRTSLGVASIKNAIDKTGGVYEVDFKDLEVASQTTSDNQTIEIVPGTDKKAVFTFKLIYDGVEVGTEKTVIWKEQDVDLILTLAADKEKIHYIIQNNGTDIAKGVTLEYLPEAGTVATLSITSPISIADIVGDGEIQEQDLQINWGGSTNGTFKFTLSHSIEGVQEQSISVNTQTSAIKMELKDDKKVGFKNNERTLKFKFTNMGTNKLDEAALKSVTFVYTTSHGKLMKGTQDVKGKNLWELLETELEVGDKKARSLDFTIDNDGAAEVEFTKIKLNNSTYTDEIASIKWAG